MMPIQSAAETEQQATFNYLVQNGLIKAED